MSSATRLSSSSSPSAPRTPVPRSWSPLITPNSSPDELTLFPPLRRPLLSLLSVGLLLTLATIISARITVGPGVLVSAAAAQTSLPSGLINGDCEAPRVEGWFSSGGARNDYEIVLDRTTFHSGHQSCQYRPRVAQPGVYGTIMQVLSPSRFIGKRGARGGVGEDRGGHRTRRLLGARAGGRFPRRRPRPRRRLTTPRSDERLATLRDRLRRPRALGPARFWSGHRRSWTPVDRRRDIEAVNDSH